MSVLASLSRRRVVSGMHLRLLSSMNHQVNEPLREQRIIDLVSNASSGANASTNLAQSLQDLGATRGEVTTSLIGLVRKKKYSIVANVHQNLLHPTPTRSDQSASGSDELSPFLGDGALQAIMESYAFLQKPVQIRNIMSFIKDKPRYTSRNISILISSYCLSDKFQLAEELLYEWLTLWLEANEANQRQGQRQDISSGSDSGSRNETSDWNSVLSETLSNSNAATASDGGENLHPPTDFSDIKLLLARIEARSKSKSNIASTANANADAAKQETVLGNISNSIDVNVLCQKWPQPEVWASLVRMYALRNSPNDAMLIFNICMSGISTKTTASASTLNRNARHAMSSISYNTLRILVHTQQYKKCYEILQRMRSSNVTANARHLGLLFKTFHDMKNNNSNIHIHSNHDNITTQSSSKPQTQAQAQAQAQVQVQVQVQLNSEFILPFLTTIRDMLYKKQITISQFGALSDSLLLLLCKHGYVNDAVNFIYETSEHKIYDRMFRATGILIVIESLVRGNETNRAIQVFKDMIDGKSKSKGQSQGQGQGQGQGSDLYAAIDRKFKPGIASVVDASYHSICMGIRKQGTMRELAEFTHYYGQSVQQD
jgi:hypothetical protein